MWPKGELAEFNCGRKEKGNVPVLIIVFVFWGEKQTWDHRLTVFHSDLRRIGNQRRSTWARLRKIWKFKNTKLYRFQISSKYFYPEIFCLFNDRTKLRVSGWEKNILIRLFWIKEEIEKNVGNVTKFYSLLKIFQHKTVLFMINNFN